VKVVRFAIKVKLLLTPSAQATQDSVEEKILEMQKQKKEVAEGVLHGEFKKTVSTLTMRDLMTLFKD
jgi:SNF2 family DNA or RNA helicase